MAFLDNVTLRVKAGRGGDGVVRWRRERAIAMGGPAGGDGGKGGDVYVVAQRNLHTLHNYAQSKEFEAADGENGGSKNMHGKGGDDLYMYFPLGSEIYIPEYEKTIDLTVEGQTEILFTGGRGGMGNTQFKSSTNRSPEEFTKGDKGEFGTLQVNLKMIADAGFIGYPNAGKSSLLNTLTNSQSKVGNYNFTTLEPHLGDYFGYILADIPGLIEGASDGRGLGIQFLKHIERTGVIVHLVDANEKNYVKAYKTIRNELGKYNPELLNKKEIVIISKIDNLGVDLNLLDSSLKSKVAVKTKEQNKSKIKSKKENTFKVLTEAKLKKLNKEEKLLYKLELAESKKLGKEAKQKIKGEETNKKFQALIVKNFKVQKKELEQEISKKSKTEKEVILLSLYEDASVKNFEKELKKSLK